MLESWHGASLADLVRSQLGHYLDREAPQITVSGYFTLSNAIGGPTAGGDFYSARDVYSWTHGKHALKMGGELSFNKTVQDYNVAVRSFPTNLFAGMLGFQPKPFFAAQPGAEKPPPVQFNFNSPAPAPATTP